MCLQRKKIYTNAHRLYRNLYTPYELQIPCGQCTECRHDKANEWRARTYYQYIETIEKGGYCLWDRLSYDDEHLPHLNMVEKHVPDKLDFTCFDRRDIQLFLKRLRTNLKSEGYAEKGNLKYLIAAEYGQEEGTYIDDKGHNREGTLRPHYHIILYSNVDITPAELSMHVKRAWKNGRTNGVEDNESYFRSKGIIDTLEAALTVSEYIGKYCLKNQNYDKVAAYKVKELIRFWKSVEEDREIEKITDKELKRKENRKRINDTLHKVKTFHIQSQGYGKYAIECENAIRNGGLLGMPDKKKIKWWQKLPMYYVRKMYYTHHYDKNTKKVIWELNETGIQWKQRNIEGTIQAYAKKLREKEKAAQNENFRQLIIEYNRHNNGKPDESAWYRLNDQLYAYRNGRPWEHFAEYVIYHKGRIYDGTSWLTPRESIRKNANATLMAEYDKRTPMYYNYVHTVDIDHFGRQMVVPYDLGDNHKGYKDFKGKELKPETFAKLYCVNENSAEEWNDYDKLQDILDRIDGYLEWANSEHEKTKERMELTWKGKMKTLYQNVI